MKSVYSAVRTGSVNSAVCASYLNVARKELQNTNLAVTEWQREIIWKYPVRKWPHPTCLEAVRQTAKISDVESSGRDLKLNRCWFATPTGNDSGRFTTA